MTTLYAESGTGAAYTLDPLGATTDGAGVAFVGDGSKLSSATFRLKVHAGSPIGPITCELWACSGTPGVNAAPSGVGPLATSPISYDAAIGSIAQDFVFSFSPITVSGPVAVVVRWFDPSVTGGSLDVVALSGAHAGANGVLNVGGWTTNTTTNPTATISGAAALSSLVPTFLLKMFNVPGIVSATTILMRNMSDVAASSGSGSGSIGFSGSVAGVKGVAGSINGSIGLSAVEVSQKGAIGSGSGAIGFKGSGAGADGVAYGVAGAIGMAGAEVGQKNATSTVAGRIGFAGSESGKRAVTTSASSGSIGLSASAQGVAGAALIVASGSASGSIGFTSSALGVAGEARVVVAAEEDSGGRISLGLYARTKQFLRKVFIPTPQRDVDGRVRGSLSFGSGSVAGIAQRFTSERLGGDPAQLELLRKILARIEAVHRDGSPMKSFTLNLSGSARGEASWSMPLTEPVLPAPLDVVPPAPPPPLPVDTSGRPAVRVAAGSVKGHLSIVGSAFGIAGVPEAEPEEDEEEELIFVLEQLLAA